MIYLMQTQNDDFFLTTDDPEKTYKRELIFGGWSALRTSELGSMERCHWVGSESRFVWSKIEYLNLP